MNYLAAILAALAVLGVAGVSAGVPSCDPAVIDKLPSLYPSGLLTNILSQMAAAGDLSYVVVSEDESKILGAKAKCIKVVIKDALASVTYKFSLIPDLSKSFKVSESPGYLIQTDGANTYFLYLIYFDAPNKVFCTYRCCKTCSGNGPNVGIAVADKNVKDQATTTAIGKARDKLTELGLDKNLVTLKACSQ